MAAGNGKKYGVRSRTDGLPLVCTNVGGIALMVEERVSGFLIQPENPKLLADALVQIIQNKALRSSMGKASFDLFKRKFHANAMAERVEAVYKSVLA